MQGTSYALADLKKKKKTATTLGANSYLRSIVFILFSDHLGRVFNPLQVLF